MADDVDRVEQELARAQVAHEAYVAAAAAAERKRVIRQGAMSVAARAGATQRQLADRLGISQAAVSKILAQGVDLPDESN